ncbi:MAG: hypothetical protein Aurels2KO_38470 [Aureliella sp.]
MGLGSILFLVVLVVAVIAFIFLLVKTASRWGILHSILLTTLFIQCWVFLVMTAGVQYVRVPATEAAFKQQERADKAEKLTIEKQWGKFTFGPDDTDAVLPLKGRVLQLTADRGRVWRGVEYLQAAGGNFELQMPTIVNEEGAAAAGPNSDSLPQGLVVYAFGEELVQKDDKQYALPKTFLGEFSVSSSQNGQITLAPLRQLGQQAQRTADSSTWTLYELMPLDSHKAFAAPGSSSTEEEIFGHMEEETLNELFSDLAPDIRAKVIAQYLNDGKQATAATPQSNLWVQIQLNEAIEEDVDSSEQANVTERGYYDLTGRAIDERIKHGKDEEGPTITLTPDDTRGKLVVLKEEAIDDLKAGTFDEVQRVNVRPLNDYEKMYNDIAIQDKELDEQIAAADRDASELTKAIANANEMIVFRQQERQQLDFDMENIEKELAVITELSDEASAEFAAMQSQMNRWYRTIQTENARRAAAEMNMLNN